VVEPGKESYMWKKYKVIIMGKKTFTRITALLQCKTIYHINLNWIHLMHC